MITEFEKLTDNELIDKIGKLTHMYNFYDQTGNENLKWSISDMLQQCYQIQDDRMNLKMIKDAIEQQPDFDATNNEKNDTFNKPTSDRGNISRRQRRQNPLRK